MKNYVTSLVLLCTLSLGFNSKVNAQTYGQQRTVQVNAEINSSTPSIKLVWDAYASVDSFMIYKMNAGSWPFTPMAVMSATDSSYTDTNVVTETIYEYKIVGKRSSGYDAYGYIAVGIKLAENTSKGTVIVIVDSTLIDTLSPELTTYQMDLNGDGYNVVIKPFDTSKTAEILKDTITSLYYRYSDLQSIFLVGALPYAYTGSMAPDGHFDHKGAWPSDMIYADVNSTYTDAVVNYTNTTDSRLSNSTSDTKYDQSYSLSDVEIQIGRLDLSRLTAFSQSEIELYQNYFEKLHNFKTGAFKPKKVGIVDDNFTTYTEAFSQNGYRNFSPLTSIDSVSDADIVTTLTSGSALWSYACGAGTFTSIAGFASSSDLASKTLNGAFALVLGSYNADVDVENNFMRAMLANGNFLTAGWAGRPNWFLHHMAIGQTIGASTKLTQNNSNSIYAPTGNYNNMMHIMLLGDPSLKNYYTPNVSNLSSIRSINKDTVFVTWSAQSGADGYNIYRSKTENGDYVKLNTSLLTTNSYDDAVSSDTSYYYRVETVELVSTNSGSYYESSVGAINLSDKNAAPLPVTLISFTARPVAQYIELFWDVANEIDFSHYLVEKYNQNTAKWEAITEIQANGTDNGIQNYLYYDVNPIVGKNIYRLKMVDYNGSFEYSHSVVVIIGNELLGAEFKVYPTASAQYVNIECQMMDHNSTRDFNVVNSQGQTLMNISLDRTNTQIDISALPAGLYFIQDKDNAVAAQRIIRTN